MMRHPRELRQGPFEEGHASLRQRPQQQRGGEPLLPVQVCAEGAEIGGATGLLDEVDR